MNNQIEQLLTVIDAFCAARGVSEARASTLIFNGGGRVKQLREGSDIGVLTSSNALIWLSANWPVSATWPPGVPRPTAQPPSRVPATCAELHP